MSSCSSHRSQSQRHDDGQNPAHYAAYNAAEVMLNRGADPTDSETSSVRNAMAHTSINSRAIHIDNFPEYLGSNSSFIYVTDDIVSGSRLAGGRMSPVRRFFCLLVTFDVLFSSLLWVITVIVTGRDIKSALYQQVMQYTIHSSMFDIVFLALTRFLILILCYAMMDLSHWWPVAFTTFSTSAFLIAKVFEYEWTQMGPITFDVTLILLSFILAWGETWFLDFRVLPLEMKAKEIAGNLNNVDCERRPLLSGRPGSMLQRYMIAPSLYEGSVANYYSPMESPEVSDDEDNVYESGSVKIPQNYRIKKSYNAKDAEYKHLGEDLIHIVTKILNRKDWTRIKAEDGCTVETASHNDKPIYKLTAEVPMPPASLLAELFYNLESFPTWNTSLKECSVLQIVDSHTDISHQVCSEVGGGISARDFVNLRHWQYIDGTYISANVSIQHPAKPERKPYVRGENGPGCFAISSSLENEGWSRVLWILNTDIKFRMPRMILDRTFCNAQLEYIQFLRKRISDLK